MRAVTYTDDTDLNNAVDDELYSTLFQRRKRALELIAGLSEERDAEQLRFQRRLVARLDVLLPAVADGLLERLGEEATS